jgi:hypothetical protein
MKNCAGKKFLGGLHAITGDEVKSSTGMGALRECCCRSSPSAAISHGLSKQVRTFETFIAAEHFFFSIMSHFERGNDGTCDGNGQEVFDFNPGLCLHGPGNTTCGCTKGRRKRTERKAQFFAKSQIGGRGWAKGRTERQSHKPQLFARSRTRIGGRPQGRTCLAPRAEKSRRSRMRHLSQSANAVAGLWRLRCKNECLGLGSWIAPDEGPGSAPYKPKKRRVRGADLRAHGFQLALDEALTLIGRVAAKDHIGAASRHQECPSIAMRPWQVVSDPSRYSSPRG